MEKEIRFMITKSGELQAGLYEDSQKVQTSNY